MITPNQQSADKNPETAEKHNHRVLAASKLEGETVYSSDGDDVGKIKEIVLDISSGRIAYVVLSSGGFLGIGDKLLAIPWNAFAIDSERKSFQLSISTEKIKNAPGFDKDSWPSMTNRAWANSVHEYYGTESNVKLDITSGGDNLPGAATSTDSESV